MIALKIHLEKTYDKKTKEYKAWVFHVTGLHDGESGIKPYPYCLRGDWMKKANESLKDVDFTLSETGFYRIGGTCQEYGIYYSDLVMFSDNRLSKIDVTEFMNRLYMGSSLDDILREYSHLDEDSIVFLPKARDVKE